MVRPMRPDRLARSLAVLYRRGLSPAVAHALGAVRHPQRAAIIDDAGTLTFEQVHRRTNALARALRASGIREGDTVAIMCRNHRWFIEATVAFSKLGANLLYLDAALAPEHLSEIVGPGDTAAVVYDEEFTDLVREGAGGCRQFLARCEHPDRQRPFTLEELIQGAQDSDLEPPLQAPRTVRIAYSNGVAPGWSSRSVPASLLAPAPLLSELPLRAGETTVLGAPLYHPWGFVQMKLGLRLGSTLVLHCEFEPQRVLADITRHQAAALVVLPEMLEQIVRIRRTTARYDTSSLQVIAVNGATLAGELAMPAMETFGAVLYNLHGQSEVRLDARWLNHRRALAARPAVSLHRHRSTEPEHVPRLRRG
jgi:acyl-CoA synthetase (AMP-forming)/AMP-acid ligase II